MFTLLVGFSLPSGFGLGKPRYPHDLSESSLTPAQFACWLLLYSLNGVECVLSSRWTVSLNLTWSLYHNKHLLDIMPTNVLYLWVTAVFRAQNWRHLSFLMVIFKKLIPINRHGRTVEGLHFVLAPS